MIFFLSLALILVVYAGYPLCIVMLSRLRSKSLIDPSAMLHWPSVSVVCAVHDEAHRVSAKIDNLAAQAYPGPMQIIFVSDGSTDETEQRLRADSRVQTFGYPQRRGKAHAINLGVANASGDVVVFTDARQELSDGAIAILAAQLSAEDVGVVSGTLVHRDPKTHQARSIGLYWRYERSIRDAESRWYSTVGATGALYAIRRQEYVPIEADTILDDFEIPMNIIRRGRRALIDPRACVYDELQHDVRGERIRKIRTLTGNFQSLARHPWMCSPRANPVFWQLLLHKVMRLFVPYALLALWLSSGLARSPLLRDFFWLQTGIYALVAVSYLYAPLRRLPGVSFLVVFVDLNVAAVQALMRFIGAESTARWEKA